MTDYARAPFEVGVFTVDPERNLIAGPLGDIQLEPKIIDLLLALAENAGDVVSRTDLIDRVWGVAHGGDESLSRAISILRKAFASDPAAVPYIETYPRRGYVLVADVKRDAGPASEALLGDRAPSNAGRGGAAPPPNSARIVGALQSKAGLYGGLVVLAAVVVLVVGLLRLGASSDQSPVATIAVMPLQNLTEDSSNAYFAEGLTDEIINALSTSDRLRVIARTSSFALQDKGLTIPQLSQRLGSDYVLEGSVRAEEGRLKVSFALSDGVQGRVLSSDNYTSELTDVIDLQETIAKRVLRSLPQNVRPNPTSTRTETPPIDLEAYRLFLEARFFTRSALEHWSPGQGPRPSSDGDKAYRLVNAALDLEPQYAPALLLKGDITHGRLTFAAAEKYPNAAKAITAAKVFYRRAADLAPDTPSVLLNQAMLEARVDWNWEEATRAFQKVLKVQPSLADAHTWFAYHLTKVGRCKDALPHAREGAALDPEFGWRRLAEPRVLTCLGRLDEAFAIYDELEPSFGAFVIKDRVLIELAERDVEGLKELKRRVETASWRDGGFAARAADELEAEIDLIILALG
ncbi:MAG: winged helix-turn-helix domain-containing protein, partial [Pseudomonadota bacterium]